MSPEQNLDLLHFKDVVREMRAAQRDFYRRRTQQDLLRAKRLETEVDKLLGFFTVQSSKGDLL